MAGTPVFAIEGTISVAHFAPQKALVATWFSMVTPCFREALERGLDECGRLGAITWITVLTVVKQVTFVRDYRVARVLARFTPRSLVFAASDCGILGSVSRQRFLNLDGLTGSLGFQRALRDDRFTEWLREAGLNSYMGPVEHARGSSIAKAALRSRPGMSGVARTATILLQWPAIHTDADASVYRVVAIERPGSEAVSPLRETGIR